LPAAPQQAGALRLIVGGATNALVLSNDVQLTALVVARGDFRAGDRLIAAGAVAARDVIIGHDGRLTFNAGFGCGSNASCDEGNSCTNDVCQDARCVRTNAPNGTACSDSNGCTQTDTCQAGACVGGNPVVCAPSDQCHAAGTCNPATGTCSNPARPDGTACGDGNACTQTDTCQAGTCVGGNPVVCTASDQCHVAGTCNPASGTCSNPPAEDGTPCADDNACTQVDACLAGACVGGDPVICTPSDQCRAAGTCDPGTGVCSDPPAGDGTPCADGNACTQADVCLAGACVGGNPVVCTPSDPCHDAGVCNPASGVCSNPPAEDGRTCADGNACTQIDACVGGVCVGSGPVVCTASDQCHDAGVCDPGSGVCSDPARPDGTTCSDGDVCTQGESCQAGVCTGGTPDPDGGTCGGDTLSMAVRLPMTHLATTVTPSQVAIYGAATTGTSIGLAPGVNVYEGITTTIWAPVANAGNGQIVLNATPIEFAHTGDIWSIGNVDLPAPPPTVVVHGDLRTSGTADDVAGQVSGAVFENASIVLGTTTITATFPTPPPADITHDSNTPLTLAPGAYGNVVLNLGSLQLSPGTYTFESLTMNTGSTLAANNATGAVRVNVRNTMVFRAAMMATVNTANLRFAVFGPGGATLGTGPIVSNVFRGTVVALNGPLIIEGGLRTYRGAFFGLTVQVFTDSTIQHIPFSAWEPPL
jgi:hypothetical protein